MAEPEIYITVRGTANEVRAQVVSLFQTFCLPLVPSALTAPHPTPASTPTGEPSAPAASDAAAGVADTAGQDAVQSAGVDPTPQPEPTPYLARRRGRKSNAQKAAEKAAAVATQSQPATGAQAPSPVEESAAAPAAADLPAAGVSPDAVPAGAAEQPASEIPDFLKRDQTKAPTHEECRGWFQKLLEKKGMEKCVAFIKQFGVDRISRLPNEKFADFIAGVTKELAA